MRTIRTRTIACTVAMAAVLSLAPLRAQPTQTALSNDSVSPRAKQLHESAIVVDSHADTTQRLIFDEAFDIGKRNTNGNIDIPRMREGGLDALFFSIWVPSEVTGPTAVTRALDQIDAVREAVRTHPHDLMLATTAADVRKAAADHKIAALMGMEGGSFTCANSSTLSLRARRPESRPLHFAVRSRHAYRSHGVGAVPLRGCAHGAVRRSHARNDDDRRPRLDG